MTDNIRNIVAYYTRVYRTSNPYTLSDYLNVTIIRQPLEDIAGCYMFLKRRKYTFLNSEIDDENFMRVVAAHELAHSILHKYDNCAFIRGKTLLLTSKIERQANLFAAHLLITDDMLREFSGCTKDQFCECTGYPKELIDLRLMKVGGISL